METKHTKWTRFKDMHSGCGNKIDDYEYIFIELPIDDAVKYFENRFNISPFNVTCSCCGEDFWIKEYETLESATQYIEGDNSLEYFLKKPFVLIVYNNEIQKATE